MSCLHYSGFPQHLENFKNDSTFFSHGNIMEFKHFAEYHRKIRRNLEKDFFSYCQYTFSMLSVMLC